MNKVKLTYIVIKDGKEIIAAIDLDPKGITDLKFQKELYQKYSPFDSMRITPTTDKHREEWQRGLMHQS